MCSLGVHSIYCVEMGLLAGGEAGRPRGAESDIQVGDGHTRTSGGVSEVVSMGEVGLCFVAELEGSSLRWHGRPAGWECRPWDEDLYVINLPGEPHRLEGEQNWAGEEPEQGAKIPQREASTSFGKGV